MFIGFSKTLAKFGGFRLGMGLRLTKSNIWWAIFALMMIYTLQAMWYTMLLVFWVAYAMGYGVYWCIKSLIKAIRGKKQERKEGRG